MTKISVATVKSTQPIVTERKTSFTNTNWFPTSTRRPIVYHQQQHEVNGRLPLLPTISSTSASPMTTLTVSELAVVPIQRQNNRFKGNTNDQSSVVKQQTVRGDPPPISFTDLTVNGVKVWIIITIVSVCVFGLCTIIAVILCCSFPRTKM